MATQDNDGVISFGTTTAQINRPAKWALTSSASGGTIKLTRKNLSDIVDEDGTTISAATIPLGTVVSIAAGDLDLSLTGGDLAESGRVDVLEQAIAEGWYVHLYDTGDNQLTGSNGLASVQLATANFS